MIDDYFGTVHYLSPGGTEDFRGNHFIFKRTEAVVTDNPKWGIAENIERIQRGDHSNLLGK